MLTRGGPLMEAATKGSGVFELFRNLYIRHEDTVVVTHNGYENFTDFLHLS